ncbi:tetratricopeptide repeat protein [Parvicella tangerina]|nr:tetratricopeptide repeat protein [Parvicella tangerina]
MKALLVIFICSVYLGVFSQIDYRLAYDLYKQTNYLDATKEFKKHLKVDPKDSKALFHIGMCYLNTNIDKGAAVTYFKKCLDTDKPDDECLFYLAQSYASQYEYEKAIENMESYLKDPGKQEEEAKKLIVQYKKAKDLYDNPLDISFFNLGDNINGPYPDYGAFCSKDEEYVVFTTRRDEGKGMKEFDGYYPSDVMITKYDGVHFNTAKMVKLNTSYDESVVGIYEDGSTIFVYYDNISEAGEIYYSELSGSNYSKKRKIPEGVNNPKTIETSASMSADEQTLFFASNRDGGKGGLDLYMTRKLPNGNWAEPQNIKALNTEGHEDFPKLASDGKTLYFCSTGHGGLGGYDIFTCTWNPEDNSFSEPKNIGYPLNTSYDDKVICYTADGNHAYVSQVRPEGYGDFDIYRVAINKERLNPAIYLVDLRDKVSNEKLSESVIYVFNENDEMIGEFIQNEDKPIAVTLDPGEYSLEIETPGYELKVMKIEVSEFDTTSGIINKVYKLEK